MEWNLRTLIRERVTRYWSHQYRIWRTALDWTVWLYFIVPGLLVAFGIYRDWWRDMPLWLAVLPDGAVMLPMLLLVWTGHLRLFIEDADILFLRQRPEWIRGLMGFGAGYSFGMHLLLTVFVFGLLSVWLVQGMGIGIAEMAAWVLLSAVCRTVFSIAGNLIRAYGQGWRRYALLIAAAIVMGFVYSLPVLRFLATRNELVLWGAAAVLLAVLTGAIAVKLRAPGTFMSDLQLERQAKLASTELLLSAVMERRPTVQLARPLIFRRSGRLFRNSDAGTMLGEMRIKSFLRQWSNVRLWFSFHGLSAAAVLLSPSWLAPAVASVLPLLAAGWLQEQWREWLNGPLVRQFQWGYQDAVKGSSLSRFWLLVAGAAWLGAAAGRVLAGWPGALIGMPCGIVYWLILNKLLEGVMDPGIVAAEGSKVPKYTPADRKPRY